LAPEILYFLDVTQLLVLLAYQITINLKLALYAICCCEHSNEPYRFHKRKRISSLHELLLAFQEGLLLSSFLGSTSQLRPWPPLQNRAEFLGGFSTIFLLQGRVVSPMPNPHPGGPGLCIYIPQRQGGYPF
jgi:hypothetical protein